MSDASGRSQGGVAWLPPSDAFAGSLPGELSGAPALPADAPHPFAIDDAHRYELRGLLGEGGMGRVELAFDRRLRREVALKSPKRPGDEHRLAHEAWITARLDHPAIVPIYEAGRRPDGTPFYVMRVSRGRTLERALADQPDLTGRLGYVRHLLAACQGVGHAHALGVVHGDLKPQNVLVGDHGEAQVADWGLASQLPAESPGSRPGAAPAGTPAYMSPEQRLGGPPDPRADVWSLGAVLFRLIDGGSPPPDATSAGLSPLPGAPPELCAIVRKAMAASVDQRYPTALALATDLEAWLEGRRVAAHDYSARQLLFRLLHAWRVPLSLAGLFLLTLAVLGVFALRRVVAERERAREARLATQESLADALLLRARDEARRGAWPEVQRLATETLALGGTWGIPAVRPSTPELRGMLMATARPHPSGTALGRAPAAMQALHGSPLRALVLDAGGLGLWRPEEGDVPWRRPDLLSDALTLAVFDGAGGVMALGRDYRLHRLRLRDGRDEVPPTQLQGGHSFAAGRGWGLAAWGHSVQAVPAGQGPLPRAAVCPRGRTVRALVVGAQRSFLAGCDDGRVLSSYDGLEWRERAQLPPDDMGLRAALSPADDQAAVLNEQGLLTLLRWPSGEVAVRTKTPLRGPLSLAFSDSGRWLAASSLRNGVWLFDAHSGHLVDRVPAPGAALAWQGEALLAEGVAGLQRWTLPAAWQASVLEVPEGDGAGVSALVIGRDGVVHVGRGDGTLQRFAPDGHLLWSARVGDQTVKDLALSADERLLYVAHVGGPTRALALSTSAANIAVAPERPAGASVHRRVTALRNGTLLVAGWRVTLGRYDSAGRALAVEENAPTALRSPVLDLDRAADASFAVVLEESGAVLLSTGDAPRLLVTVPGAVAVAADGVVPLAGSPGGSRPPSDSGARDGAANGPPGGALAGDLGAAAVGVWVVDRQRARRFDAHGQLTGSFPVAPGTLDALVAQPGRLVLAGPDGAVVYGADGRSLALLRGHSQRVGRLAADAEAVYTGSWDGAVRRWGWQGLSAGLGELWADTAIWGGLNAQ